MAIRATTGTPDQPTLDAATSRYRIKTTCSELSRGAFQQPAKNPNAAKYMATFSSADDKKCDALQAADAVVYEIRRALNLSFGHGRGTLRQQFSVLHEGAKIFLIQHANRQNLLSIVANSKLGEPLSLDDIMEQEIDHDLTPSNLVKPR